MSNNLTILENIKKHFIQIDQNDFEILRKILERLWNSIRKILNLGESDNDLDKNFLEFMKFFDPIKTPASRLKVIEKLPNLSIMINETKIPEELIIKLQDLSIIYLIRRSEIEYPLITPEGLIFYFALTESKKYDQTYRLNTLIIQNFEKLLMNTLRKFAFAKLKNLQIKKKEAPNLSNLDLAIILFFLINGSIDEEKAFTRDANDSERALNCIVQAYNSNREMNDEIRNDLKEVPIRILQSDLPTLQKKIGYAIHNERSKYYLKSKHLPFVLDVLKTNFDIREKNELKSRWGYIIKEYNHWRSIFRQNNICFYDYLEIERLEKEILKV